jgi:hypothetical protein
MGLLSLGLMLERSIEIKLVLGQELCDISRQFIFCVCRNYYVTAVGSQKLL